MSNNKNSGINTTEANYYIFVCPNNILYEMNIIYVFETIKLKNMIEANKSKLLIKNAPCRDYKNNIYSINKGYIFPEFLIKETAIKYEIILKEHEQLFNIINELI
jgi:hypothetical protein